jgi:hypothetical protein
MSGGYELDEDLGDLRRYLRRFEEYLSILTDLGVILE